MKALGLIVAVAAVAAMGLVLDAQSRVAVVRPEAAEGPSKIFARGRVEGATPEVDLRFRVAGRVAKVFVEEGQVVQRGQVLAQLEDDELRQEVAVAEADLALAEAQLQRLLNGAHSEERLEAAARFRAKKAELQRAELSWNRINALSRSQAVTPQEVDNQRMLVAGLGAELEAAKARVALLEAPARSDDVRIEQARVQASRARVKLAGVQLDHARLLAPSDGRVLKIDAAVGELAGPSAPKPAVIFSDTSRRQVRAFVDEMDAPRLKTGMTAKVLFDGFPDQPCSGRIVRLSPRMGPKELFSDRPAERLDTKTREVWIELPPGDTLVVGLRADVIVDPESWTPPSAAPHGPPESPGGGVAAGLTSPRP